MSTMNQLGKYLPYPEYKDSGLSWLGDIPTNWEIKKLKYLGDAIIGLTYSPDDVVGEDDGILVLRSSNIQSRKLVFDDNVYVSRLIPSKLMVKTGDILICARNGSRALIGKNAVIDESAEGSSFGAFMSVFRSQHNGFLSKVFNSTLFDFQAGTFLTSTINQLTTGNLNSFEVPFPPEAERSKIIAFLDYETARIDQMIAKQQQLIELLKEKRQAVISHAVTKGLNPNAPMKDSGVEWLGQVPEHWVVARLKQVIESGSSISYGIVQPGDALDAGIPFIQTTNISQGNLALAALPKTSESIEKDYPRSRLKGGEVILGIRASIGAAYVVPEELKGVNLSRGVARIQPGKLITSEFLVCFFKTNAVETYWGLSKQGSTFSEVSIETVRELNVVLPPEKEQQEICYFVDSISSKFKNIVDSAELQNKLLMERRTALISAAVTGKIDLRGWQPPQSEGAA